jgi:hypothetical protein
VFRNVSDETTAEFWNSHPWLPPPSMIVFPAPSKPMNNSFGFVEAIVTLRRFANPV